MKDVSLASVNGIFGFPKLYFPFALQCLITGCMAWQSSNALKKLGGAIQCILIYCENK